ncbi:epimerase [Planctomycetota bacterium]|nr:epimerase [Planctomycetota bacterium]
MNGICFVTGVSGFVGANLAPLLAQRYRLRCLVRKGQHVPALNGIDYERVEGTLEDELALATGVRGAEIVVHLAALVSFRREDRATMFRLHSTATAQLASLARLAKVRRLLHMSTICAVGFSDRPRLLDERDAYNFGPLRIGYCDSKHAAEAAIQTEIARGLNAVIVNPPSMYGAGDRRKAADSLMDALLRGRIKLLPPGGINVADVMDVCRGCLLAIDRGRSGERYLLGGENLTGGELFSRIATIVGGKAPRIGTPAIAVRAVTAALRIKERLFGSKPPLTSEVLALAQHFLFYSSNKARDELGYAPGSVDSGIRASWAWIQQLKAPPENHK